jgi:hypothetical protein
MELSLTEVDPTNYAHSPHCRQEQLNGARHHFRPLPQAPKRGCVTRLRGDYADGQGPLTAGAGRRAPRKRARHCGPLTQEPPSARGSGEPLRPGGPAALSLTVCRAPLGG